MNLRFLIFASAWLASCPILPALDAAWNSSTDIPLSTSGADLTGQTISLTLNFAPTYSTELTVIENAGLPFIQGEFDNLSQGQIVGIPFDGVTHYFAANYFGGTGNDLVLRRLSNWLVCWGRGDSGQLGVNANQWFSLSFATTVRQESVPINTPFFATATGGRHTLALKIDGSLLAWGANDFGQLGLSADTSVGTGAPSAVDVTPGVSALAGKRVIAIAAGKSHTLALCSDGSIAAWGDNSAGQLGTGDATPHPVPVAVHVVPGSSALAGRVVVAIAAGQDHSLALCSDGAVVSWGANSAGQLGDGTTEDRPLPVLVSTAAGQSALEGRSVISLSAGGAHNLALCADGAIVAWGANHAGQLGDDSTTDRYQPVLVNAAVGVSSLAGKVVTSIAAGGSHSLALCDDGSISAWGKNINGQLGDTTNTDQDAPVAVDTGEGSALAGKAALAIAAGKDHSAAACDDGTVCTWGRNTDYQLGSGSTVARSSPGLLQNTIHQGPPSLDGWSLTGSSSDHNLMIWLLTPLPKIEVKGPDGVVLRDDEQRIDFGAWAPGSITAAKTITFTNTGTADLLNLALTADGPGAADYEMSALPADHLTPGESMTVNFSFAPTVAGGRSVQLHLASNLSGSLSVFDIRLGGTGTGEITANLDAPSDIPVSSDGFIATGSSITVNLGYAPATGANLMLVDNLGQDFIDGEFSNLPQGQTVTFPFGDKVYSFVANYFGGSGNDLVLQWKDNIMVKWGASPLISSNNFHSSPVSAGTLAGKTVAAISVGAAHNLVVATDGTLWAWGDNRYGQLGNHTPAESGSLLLVNRGALTGKRIVACAAGYSHSLALDSNGVVYAWGDNSCGQLGDDTTSRRSSPIQVSTALGVSALAGKKVVAIAAGNCFSAALCSDGTCALWGANGFGQLGVNDPANRYTPAALTTTTNIQGRRVVQIVCGADHCLALLADGAVMAWGRGEHGQLGTGALTGSFAPTSVRTNQGLSDLYGKEVTSIAAGGDQSLALCADGELVGWGDSRAAGNGATSDQPFPTLVSRTQGLSALFGKEVRSVAAGLLCGAAVCADGSVATWGSNIAGVLGDGTTTSRTHPVLVDTANLQNGEVISQLWAAGTLYAPNGSGLFLPRMLGIAALPPRPQLTLTMSGTPLTGTSNVSMGSLVVGTKGGARIFTITNSGTAPLEGLSVWVDAHAEGEFVATQPGLTTLNPGQGTNFAVTFTPNDLGWRPAWIHVNSDAPSNSGHINFQVSGDGIVTAIGPAEIRRKPDSAILPIGSPARSHVVAQGAATLNYQWKKNGRNIRGALTNGYDIASVRLTDAAAYTCRVGNALATVESDPGILAVVDTSPRNLIQAAGTTMTLTAVAAGPDLTWQWFKDDTIIEGATGKTFRIAKVANGDTGAYRCTVRSAGGQLDGGIYDVKIFDSAPILLPPADGILPDTMVADTYSYQIAVDPAISHLATHYSASGLPRGLRIDGATGLISGKPTTAKATPYKIVVTASNSRFSSSTTLYLSVTPLPTGVIGKYTALTSDDPYATGTGTFLEFATTATGAISGRLRVGSRTFACSGSLESDVSNPNLVSGTIVARRDRDGDSPLELNFDLDANSDLLTNGVFAHDGISFEGWRNPWSSDHPASDFTGYHTFSLQVSSVSMKSIPQGHGYGSFAVNSTSGRLTVAGKLPDGTTLTCSTWVGPTGQIALSKLLYRGSQGGIIGQMNLSPAAPIDSASLTGAINWTRPPAEGSRNYPAGFLAENVFISGGRYIASTGTNIILDLDPSRADNAILNFTISDGSYVGPPPIPDIRLSIGARNRVKLPTAAENPRRTRIAISTSRGAFSGSFTMVDPNPLSPTRRISRIGRFYGLISRDSDARLRGHGWFLLPELPLIEGETSANTAVQSGFVILDAAQ